jgi:hypothetical protein
MLNALHCELKGTALRVLQVADVGQRRFQVAQLVAVERQRAEVLQVLQRPCKCVYAVVVRVNGLQGWVAIESVQCSQTIVIEPQGLQLLVARQVAHVHQMPPAEVYLRHAGVPRDFSERDVAGEGALRVRGFRTVGGHGACSLHCNWQSPLLRARAAAAATAAAATNRPTEWGGCF